MCVAALAAGCSSASPPTAEEIAATATIFEELDRWAERGSGDIATGGPCPFNADGAMLIEKFGVLCSGDENVTDGIGYRVTQGVTAYSLEQIESDFADDGFAIERHDDGEWLLVERGSQTMAIAAQPVADSLHAVVVLSVNEPADAAELMQRFTDELAANGDSWVRSLSRFTLRDLFFRADGAAS